MLNLYAERSVKSQRRVQSLHMHVWCNFHSGIWPAIDKYEVKYVTYELIKNIEYSPKISDESAPIIGLA